MKTLLAAILAAVALAATASTAVAAPSTTTGTTTFNYPRMVANFIVKGMNAKPSYYNVRAASVSKYRIVIKGILVEDDVPFTAHLTKVARTKIRITIYAYGMSDTEVTDIGFNL